MRRPIPYLRLVSVILYGASLLLVAFTVDGNPVEKIPGWQILVSGWLGFLLLQPAWIANIAFALSFLLWGSRRSSFALAIAAPILGLMSLLWDKVPVGGGGSGYRDILSWGPGFYAWITAMIVLLAARIQASYAPLEQASRDLAAIGDTVDSTATRPGTVIFASAIGLGAALVNFVLYVAAPEMALGGLLRRAVYSIPAVICVVAAYYGRNWGRVFQLVLAAMGPVFQIAIVVPFAITEQNPGRLDWVAFLVASMTILSTVLFFLPPSNSWFRAKVAERRDA